MGSKLEAWSLKLAAPGTPHLGRLIWDASSETPHLRLYSSRA
jgi:hypothetical protein